MGLLEKANLNWVWITWSVGYSWQDETVQREQCRNLTAELHKRGIHVCAYMCAASMFWESMFRDEPRSTRWLAFDPQGVPFRYSSGRDPMRFIADVANPEWVAYQKQRIGAALDAGVDAIFLDNTAAKEWAPNETMDRYIGQLRRYMREEKRSGAPLLTNYGLASGRAHLNRNMDVVFAEYWMEPGVWGDEWNVSNVRRMNYLRGIVPEWKPMISEYSRFHASDRGHGWLKPKSARLGIAEAAAFRSAYAWDMEGPFDAALVDGDTGALETWASIGQYNGFLKQHPEIYVGARGVAPVAVLTQERRPGNVIGFGWDRDDNGLYDALARASVLHDILLAGHFDDRKLERYAAIVVPPFVTPDAAMLARYQTAGGRVYQPAAGVNLNEYLERVRALAPGGPAVQVEGAGHVLANVTRLGTRKALAVHLLNYAPETAVRVHVRLAPGTEFASLAGARPRLFTPDRATAGLAGSGREFTLDSLETYAVVILE